MNVSPWAGWIWPNSLVPRVCVPGANQKVVFAFRPLSPKLELSPAATVIAPAGADEGPVSSPELPQTARADEGGGELVVGVGEGAGVGVAVTVGVGVGVAGELGCGLMQVW
jgi:hypothetical protein